MSIKKLQIFDFDETLFRVPSYTDRFKAEKQGLSFPDPYTYYDHPISLNPAENNIQLIGPVYDEWKKGKLDPECMQILITHRVEAVRPEVMDLLEDRQIEFDEYFFLGRASKKTETLKKILPTLPELIDIEVYEDSIQQIAQYHDFFIYENIARYLIRPLGSVPEYNVNITIVDKSKIYRIQRLQLSEERRIVLL
jgi:hypothetical protein